MQADTAQTKLFCGPMNNRILHKFLLRPLLAGVGATLLSASPTLSANKPGTPIHYFALPGGALEKSLKSFSDQSDISLIYDHRIIAGKHAQPLSGALTTHDALGALLDGSSLEYLEIDKRTLAIINRPTVVEFAPDGQKSKTSLQRSRARVDEILVTASYRTPGAATGARVNYALDAETLELSGAQNIAEPIRNLPANIASVTAANTQLLTSASGLNLTDLRGLGAARSLVLVNNRRLVRTSGGNEAIFGVDLNAIPTALIDRVEIINQGAGASLGTDAVAGAINIVMRDHIDGIAFSAQGGISERGDAAEYSVSVFTGTEFADRQGRISGGVVYAMDPSLFYTDREYLSQPFGFALNGQQAAPAFGEFTRGFGGSTFTPAGRIVGAIEQNGDAALIPDAFDSLVLTPDGFENFGGRINQLYNWLTGFSALPEIDRLHGYGRVDYDASSTMSVFAEVLFANIDTVSQIAPAPVAASRGVSPAFGNTIVVPVDHPDAPAGLRQAIEASVGGPVESFLVSRRFVELGPRRYDINRQVIDFVFGADVDLGDGWSLNGSYKYGQSRSNSVESGLPDASRVSIAVDPTRCAATPDCALFNIFSGEFVPSDVADFYGSETRVRRIQSTEQIARLVGSGPLYQLGEQEGRISAGVEYRRDRLNDEGNVSSSGGPLLGGFQARPASGSVGYGELFAGAELPVSTLSNAIGAIEFGVDVRLTRWDGGGFVANFSGDFTWSPAPGLEIYAFALRGGRAPNVVELFAGGLTTSEVLNDPCSSPSNPQIIANCATRGALGTPMGFVQQNPLVSAVVSGNPNLDNETIRTHHFGLAADIHEFASLGDNTLRLAVDWRHHRVSNGIDKVNSRLAIDSCYLSENLESPLCGVNPATGDLFIRRDPTTRQLSALELAYTNIGESRVSGLDATLTFQRDLFWGHFAPRFSVDVLYSYTHKAAFGDYSSAGVIDQVGLVDFPRHQIYTTASLETDRWKTLLTVRRRGTVQTSRENVLEATLAARTNVDLGVRFRADENIIVYAGVENLLDAPLPIAPFAEQGYFAAQYDPIGRRYFAGVKAEF